MPNYHPVDELAILRVRIKELQQAESDLRAKIIADHNFSGVGFVASVVEREQVYVLGAELRRKFPDSAWLKPFLKKQTTRMLVIKPREW